ncbi:MAG: glutamine--fructose-6-phosphate transaminase (isomerizing) [Actinomycetales bacterium]|nr:glutamine--fructose-6-phosphate transaminase (isomerizing) [Actinomycetales bacterium]
MCGIVGYVGPGSSLEVLMGGLRRLEYRGYDSAGVAVLDDDGELGVRKRAGKLAVLAGELESDGIRDGHTGIGHTRWATHGGPTDGNAHPHLGDDGRLALIHNGIIENFAELKAELADETFTSETDTEIAALLVGRLYRETGDLTEALRRAVARLEGAFTILAMHRDDPGVVVGARRNSPLVIGLGEGENFLGSDVAAFVAYTKRAMEIGQDQIVTIRPDSVEVTDFAGNPVTPTQFEIAWDASAAEKGGWPSFMKKEVSEEPAAVANTLRGRIHDGRVTLPELDAIAEILDGVTRIIVIACGTAAYAGMLGRYAIEAWSRIPIDVELSHEFRYRDPVLDEHTLVVSVSQSGETMDTLRAVQYAREKGARTLAICNTQGATIPRESDAVLYIHAGPEVAVASTKAFVAQVTALYLLGLDLAARRGTLSPERIAELIVELQNVPDKLDDVLDAASSRIAEFTRWLAETQSVIFLGRHVGYPVALEGALKLKEIAYIHAEGFAAGELKHGPIALIEPGQLVIVLVPSPRNDDSLHPKVVSNIQEIRARGARVIAIAEVGDVAVVPFADEVIRIPFAGPFFEPILGVVPLHIFAMEMASAKGLDVDQPRNLAKSVTVE